MPAASKITVAKAAATVRASLLIRMSIPLDSSQFLSHGDLTSVKSCALHERTRHAVPPCLAGAQSRHLFQARGAYPCRLRSHIGGSTQVGGNQTPILPVGGFDG